MLSPAVCRTATAGLARLPASRLAPVTPRFFATQTGTIDLAYDLHEPPKSDRSRQDAPIIFMHGLFGSKKNNRSVSKVLARDLKRHVFAVDLRNHGESPHAPIHNYTAMAEDVAAFINQNGIENPTLIGHSMGAKTAMALALDQPDLISDFVSVDNAPLDAALNGSFAKYIQGMRKIEDAGVTRQSDADKILAEYESDLTIRQFLLGNLARNEDGVQKFRVPLATLAKSLDNLGDFPFKDPNQARFVKPALFVRGTKSRYVPDEAIPIIGQFFPRFQMVDVDAGHWVTSEKPQEFLKAVIEFLKPQE
ncbi:Alpha/Beta hydrolase protein [Microdochium trichocladiopsis]|uniref:Alpha/Beta hydrolase protein n=1 Tax=Microdochium trichocladiopsis TaxID=1682393 RepID=A0A9P8YB91_9PEZI|nr:Alpha/Beta hydrolase protein [Microdochium trichocladiopsis]KAH7033022.1 Alpha/Beta hydrolase protein [Microdochium trichocladiopsis]